LTLKKKGLTIVIIFLLFIVYFLVASRPIPRETVLNLSWISSLLGEEGNYGPAVSSQLIPFTLGSRYGYVDTAGQFALNKFKTDNIYLSSNMWTEYSAEPASVVINNIIDNSEITIENARGYPILLDNRIFILSSEQNALSEIGRNGNILWTYEFGAPLTAIDVRAGLVLTGSLDGMIEVFNSDGERIFHIDPTGSRFSVILGCAISRNGSRIAVISGIDRQRFLLFERLGNTGGEYKIIYHEFLETGFRRPVRVLFIDDDQRIIFEREGGIGFFNTRSRSSLFIPLDGEIAAIDESGDRGYLFLVTSHSFQQKNLIGIKFPPNRLFGVSQAAAQNAVFLRAPFKSDDVFLGRVPSSDNNRSSMLIAGGGTTLISFNMEEK